MKQKALHIDLGGISYHPNEALTGIPRVTLSLAREMSQLSHYRGMDLNVMSLLHEGQQVPDDVLDKFDLARPRRGLSSAGGVIFLLDIYYFKYNFLNKLPAEIRDKYTVVDYIHDIIPITNEGMCEISGFKFKSLIRQGFNFSDAIMTPSRKVVDDIVDYITSSNEIQVGESLKLGFNHHGADFSSMKDCTRPSRFDKPYFLMVGTVEVRKNHLHALEAFEALWEMGVDVTLCIAGRVGWKVEPWVEKIENHPERNKRLFFINEPSDEELACLYVNAHCLLFASAEEGFGLPVVEAAHYKVPLLLSDIAIFREVAGPHARYFSLEAVSCLVEAIIEFNRDVSAGRATEDSSQIKKTTWLQSATNILDGVIDDRWCCTINADKSVDYHDV